jgi:hypothetical protein
MISRVCVLGKMAKGRRYRSQTKNVVMKVHSYFEDMYKRSRTCGGPLKRTAEATGLSQTVVKRIKAEFKQNGNVFSSPTKRYLKSRRLHVDNFDREAIRRLIYSIYQSKEHVTLDTLLVSNALDTELFYEIYEKVAVKDKGLYQGGRTTLQIILKEMGFQ